MPHFFTLEEANGLLPKIKPLMAELLAWRAKIIEMRHEVAGILQDTTSNVGSPATSALVQDFMAIDRLLAQIHEYGCEVKDLNVGLLDFLAEMDGREVYLCWRFGEEEIAYYHDLHTGFGGRRRIPR
ncbi:MAG: DUF2203 domain-containing protein [Ardenticatenales bacterium]|nr:DUF2203 domain-containing protein [Ardenticatenales bacterium]